MRHPLLVEALQVLRVSVDRTWAAFLGTGDAALRCPSVVHICAAETHCESAKRHYGGSAWVEGTILGAAGAGGQGVWWARTAHVQATSPHRHAPDTHREWQRQRWRLQCTTCLVRRFHLNRLASRRPPLRSTGEWILLQERRAQSSQSCRPRQLNPHPRMQANSRSHLLAVASSRHLLPRPLRASRRRMVESVCGDFL